MKIIKNVLKVLLILLIIYLISAFFAKSSYKVERSAIINAPENLVYNNVGILRNWENWSPWKEKDPSATNSYSGPDGKAKSIMRWAGDKKKSGSGQVEIITANSPILMYYKLNFDGPPAMSSMGMFQLSELAPEKTNVRWSDSGEIPFILRPMMMFASMDKFMGPDFERGLVKLDSLCVLQKMEAKQAMKKDSIH
jgi:hypothetical protein